MKRSKIIYVSGKYTDETKEKVSKNIELARQFSIKIWELGYTALCPHLNTMNFEESRILKWEDYIKGDLFLIDRCDGIFMLPNWSKSKGAKLELKHAMKLKLPIFFGLYELEVYKWKEKKKPKQFQFVLNPDDFPDK